MNAPARKFEAKAAVRERVPLLIGLMGPSGSGKTFSALRLASGIQSVTDGDIYLIDTEARRALHYADMFKFRHVQFDPPHGSLDYLAAIEQSYAAGARIIVVDSMSHEHSGVGGMIDFQERELDRMAGDDSAKREKLRMLAWQKPKAARRRLIDRMLQINANFIFCFRAKESVKPMKVGGKTEIIFQGFMPIAGDEFLFEQTVNILLLPKSGGIPSWQSENIGEKLMMKLPQQFVALFVDAKPLDEATGRALAEWASGTIQGRPLESARGPERPTSTHHSSQPGKDVGLSSERVERLDKQLAEAAASGTATLMAAWNTLTAPEKKICKAALDRRHKLAALAIDKEAGK
jgi:ABC-type dipeptide/oligopeptide/nickel transport system ATPase subunit